MYSWDAKFWTTLIPLLIKPGKVSKDYINGKRIRYTNPFQFYLTVSILFFLILGAVNKYQEFEELRRGVDKETIKKEQETKENLKKSGVILDSIQNITATDLNKQLENLDSAKKVQLERLKPFIGKDLTKVKLDTTPKKKNKGWTFNSSDPNFNKMFEYQKEHPDAPMDDALDSLKITKNLWNRFLYTRASVIKGLMENTREEGQKMLKEILSYATIAIFIFLPIFTLFLKFLYLRRKYTYVEHLVFVFHTQTVFFILMILFFVLSLFSNNDNISWIFFVLFLLYLFIAMKKFYQQGFFKTLIKFFILNNVYMILAGFGAAIVAVVAFALY